MNPALEPVRVQATVLPGAKAGGKGSQGQVDRVRVRLRDGSTAVVRLMGVRQPRSACRPAARRVLAKQLRPGRTVVLVRDRRAQVDKPVPRRYVMVKRKDVGKKLVRQGHLRVAKGAFTRKKAYKKVQKAAKHHRRGHWGRC